MTSLCTQLQVVEINCEKISAKTLSKISNLTNISDLEIKVLEKCFTPEFISICRKNNKMANLKVWVELCRKPIRKTQIIVKNFTEVELCVGSSFIPEDDITKFLFPQITKLKLEASDLNFEFHSEIEKLKNLTELIWKVWLDFSDSLKFLEMAKRMKLKQFRTNYSFNESKSFFLREPFHVSCHSFQPDKLAKILEKVESFNPEKLSLTNFGLPFSESALRSIIRLKSLEQIHLSFWDILNKDRIAKTLFEELPHLEKLTNYSSIPSGVEDTCKVENLQLQKVENEKSTVYVRKTCVEETV